MLFTPGIRLLLRNTGGDRGPDQQTRQEDECSTHEDKKY